MAKNNEYEFFKTELNRAYKRERKLQKEVERLTRELQTEMNKKEDVYKQFIGEIKSLMLPSDDSSNDIIEAKVQKKSKFEKLKNKATQGSSKAQFSMASIYSKGLNDVKIDKEKALYWYKKSAKNGNDKAQYNLGVFYESGKNIKQNINKSVAWFEKAAKQDNVKAQYNLAVIYANGSGVEKNLSMTKFWATKAIENDFEKAQTLWNIFELDTIKD